MVQPFIDALRAADFKGECATDYATRVIFATDNSIFQLVPTAVIFPKSEADISAILTLAAQPEFQSLYFAPRGGGTGTNGQSLSDGIVIDCSRFMRHISPPDLNAETVEVQPGVVLDELNRYLKPTGYFFAPHVSPGSRATIGGMINTDACGKGSRVYGRTSDHIVSMRLCVADGTVFSSDAFGSSDQNEFGRFLSPVTRKVAAHKDEIDRRFPPLTRSLTGFNFKEFLVSNQVNPNKLICGSEGTLGIVTSAVLKLTKIPIAKTLAVLQYPDFDAALRDAPRLLEYAPQAIESIDGTLLTLARNDIIFTTVQKSVKFDPSTGAINLVEFPTPKDEVKIAEAPAVIQTDFLDDPADIQVLWELRKKSVGLLGAMPGRRKPVPFVEDTVVPPDVLPDYIREFRQILDAHQLTYGMFGHADVGCIHVRPALDMQDPGDQKLIEVISAQVNELVQRYNGLFWGEHSKGFRTAPLQDTFGPVLVQLMKDVKAHFDPHDRLNPGKLVSAQEDAPDILPKFKGEYDAQIGPKTQEMFSHAIECNGNGQCFQVDPNVVMCPSYLVTQNRLHSPKGRAQLLREWMRLKDRGQSDLQFESDVLEALNGCLNCHACTYQCPVQVNIPKMKSLFLSDYYQKVRRPFRDYLFCKLESALPILATSPKIANGLMRAKWVQGVLKKIGICDIPLLDSATRPVIRSTGSSGPQEVKVAIWPDAFNHYYSPRVMTDFSTVLESLGILPRLLRFSASGKAEEVLGMRQKFTSAARRNWRQIEACIKAGQTVVGIDPSIVLLFRQDYPEVLGLSDTQMVQLPQEFLTQHLATMARPKTGESSKKKFTLFLHCTESAGVPDAGDQWQAIFTWFGLELKIARAGCCGMAGMYGHKTENRDRSQKIFEMSWAGQIDQVQRDGREPLACGYSCRSQVNRFQGRQLRHPIQVLAQVCLNTSHDTSVSGV